MGRTLRVAILGATGYTGGELIRLLHRHPGAELSFVSSERFAGQSIAKVYTHLQAVGHLICQPMDAKKACEAADFIFCALPHVTSMEVVPELLQRGAKVVDLSADFRLKSAETYAHWYGTQHLAPELLPQAAYGLPELFRESIKGANLVANPGCYPTSVQLPLFPLLQEGMIDPALVIADSKSGVSGAGRSPAQGTLFAELSEGFKAYKVEAHRHIPEMEQNLALAAGKEIKIRFTPHLLPQSRGILSTCYLRPTSGVNAQRVRDTLMTRYRDEPFVTVLPHGDMPATSDVRGSNACHMGVTEDLRSGWLIIVSVIDNLVKGASGAAVQNFNLMTGWDETTALDSLPMFP
ncbi:N-acetyl-gamma-glutamyl-phosphate reductase [Magnetococcus marinus MC-1]|uniref:N-acetyl-gamma-glutamyl-phosphate reductase n=1 Tax=Magnetococcus marinus (strain ATCC BAA-1437 / JCM 17883 / MC-1) TaxID=156889 RepID=ARGC_MAGMM|nr:N-acetyl-gamma-glutamyl-phosphate reductase [Magnetococcus marinus]A0L482.1 RecName: Full=N-acetyl-gamma-glutamyl-phosphate reductase; Short=AGPR; AltName: Full=N-acetyl-glutamate semialdehyde dehydrogenase; Short=NAGSA dehydrogenase [Magnetococcus marinus MC-1]ABK42775.1 N-acetyl-gamma-glutamyl-phosphate reductase [Magnetococcus marinus MC-1]